MHVQIFCLPHCFPAPGLHVFPRVGGLRIMLNQHTVPFKSPWCLTLWSTAANLWDPDERFSEFQQQPRACCRIQRTAQKAEPCVGRWKRKSWTRYGTSCRQARRMRGLARMGQGAWLTEKRSCRPLSGLVSQHCSFASTRKPAISELGSEWRHILLSLL